MIDDLFLFGLSDDYRPGSDLMSKLMLKDKRMVALITRGLFGEKCNDCYTTGRCQFVNGGECDTLYLSNSRDFPHIIIEVQNIIDEGFMQKAMGYCLEFIKEHGTTPVLLVFSIKGFSSKSLEGFFEREENQPYIYNTPSEFWPEECLVLSPISIATVIQQDPLKPLVALSHFFSEQKLTLFDSEKRQDATIQYLYGLAKEKFEGQGRVEVEKMDVIVDLCSKVKVQLQKAGNALESGDVAKAKSYVNDAQDFFALHEKDI